MHSLPEDAVVHSEAVFVNDLLLRIVGKRREKQVFYQKLVIIMHASLLIRVNYARRNDTPRRLTNRQTLRLALCSENKLQYSADFCKRRFLELVLASGNRYKAIEIAGILKRHRVVCYNERAAPIEIDENGASYAQNALIKARAVFEYLRDQNAVVIGDDSGISVEALGGEPNIRSARYAAARKERISDEANLLKLTAELKRRGLSESKAFYTTAIALKCGAGEFTAHGWLYGTVIAEPRGANGFGYDPIFVPETFNCTLGELSAEVKAGISHRFRALTNIAPLLSVISR
jgi:XTP/dITP diphosphohydrolase